METPFYRPAPETPEIKYLLERRKKLGGFLPARVVTAAAAADVRKLDYFAELLKGAGTRGCPPRWRLSALLDHAVAPQGIGKQVVPIIPDEARTFGLDALFREIGIYSPKGQLYEPVDKESLALLQRNQGRADSGGRHHRSGFDVVVHRGGHGLRQRTA